MLATVSGQDQQVLVGPGPGLDCAVIDVGNTLLVVKSDPITFTADDLGKYLVQVNVNDIATTGALPRWLMVTLLFPEAMTTPDMVRSTFNQLNQACAEYQITLIGGHTEITHALDRTIAIGTLIGTVRPDALITPQGAAPGDRLLLTKSVPIEAVAILSRAFYSRLQVVLSAQELEEGLSYLADPGISVLRDAQIAVSAGKVNAMHDPTEGGLLCALWELAEACNQRIVVDLDTVPVSPLARRLCAALEIDPLAAISSGALLLSVPEESYAAICATLKSQDIPCTTIGRVARGPATVWHSDGVEEWPLARPARDEVARLFEES